MTDLQMIRNPDKWPAWPFLPLVRGDRNLEGKNMGVLVDDGKVTTVYHVYLFGLPKTREEFKKQPKTEYGSHEAMLADGWRVD